MRSSTLGESSPFGFLTGAAMSAAATAAGADEDEDEDGRERGAMDSITRNKARERSDLDRHSSRGRPPTLAENKSAATLSGTALSDAADISI
jgi:hypothetical protein